MFDTLSERLRKTLGDLTGRGRISEADVDAAMREVRLALLEADVNFKVVKDFVARVRERAVGADILESLNAGQQVIKIVHEELTALLVEQPDHFDARARLGRLLLEMKRPEDAAAHFEMEVVVVAAVVVRTEQQVEGSRPVQRAEEAA